MRISCKKFLLLLFPLVLIFALAVFTACGNTENPGDAKTALTAPEIELTENVISWNTIEHAESYEIYENSTLVKTVEKTSYEIVQTAKGTYTYKVKALSADEKYSSSKFSNEVVYVVNNTQLSAPAISKHDNVISWTAVDHADGYEIFEDGELVSSQSETSYTIARAETGVYKYTVKATSTNSDYLESELSNEVTHIISEQLAAPHISIEGKVISWQAIPHAETYVIYENGVVIYQSWDSTSYEIEQTIVGEYAYYVVARSSNPVYLMSENSNTENYTVEPTPLATPDGLAIDGNLLSWNEVDDGSKEYNPSYNVYENDLLVSKRQSDNFYVIPIDHEAGEFEYTVKAIPAGRDTQHLESDKSEPFSHTITDDRIQLDTPSGLYYEQREEYKNPPNADGSRPDEIKVTREYIVWNPVDNATGYFVYDNGNLIYATQSTEYMISEVTPGTHEYQIKAMASVSDYKPSELSAGLQHEIAVNNNTEFMINIDTSNATGFNSQVKVALWAQNGNGMPYAEIPNTEKTIAAGGNSATIIYNNRGRYIAKLSDLPVGYAATEVKLSAAVTQGTISIYSTSSKSSITLNRPTTIRATQGVTGGTVGVDREYLFIAPTQSQYAIETEGNLICTVNGVERYMFSADKDEAVLITVNCQSAGEFKFTVVTRTKQYLNFGEMSNGLSGQSNVIPDGQETTIFYLHPSSEPKLYTFIFTTATMGNTRFVTLTINGVDYEFDGGYCTTRNITIPASDTDIEISAKLYGTAPGEGLSSVQFFVIPLTEE